MNFRTNALLATLLTVTLASAHAENWAEYSGPNRNNRSSETNILKDWSNGLKVKWRQPVHAGFGGASVHGSEVFIFDRLPQEGDKLLCFDVNTGAEKWSTMFEGTGRLPYPGSRTVPTVTDEMVFATSGWGLLVAVDRKTHKTVWSVNLLEKFGFDIARFGYSCSPLLVDNLVIVTTPGSQNSLVAFEAKTGKVTWKAEGVRGQSYESPVLRKLCGVAQVTVQIGKNVMGLDPKTGKNLWTYNGYSSRSPIPQATQIGDNQLFLTAGYGAGSQLIELSTKDGKWSIKTKFTIRQEGGQVHPAIYLDKHLYVNFNRNRNLRGRGEYGVVCLDMEGKIKWQTKGKPAFNRGTLLFVDGLILTMGGEDGVLRAMKPAPEGFKQVGEFKVFKNLKRRNNNIWAPMALSNKKLLIRSQNQLVCVDLSPDAKPAKTARKFFGR